MNLQGNDLPKATQPLAEPKLPGANAVSFLRLDSALGKLDVPLAEETDVDYDRFWGEEDTSRGANLGLEAGCPHVRDRKRVAGIKTDTESQQPGGDLADSGDDPCVVRLLRGTGKSADQRRERLSVRCIEGPDESRHMNLGQQVPITYGPVTPVGF